MAYENATVSQMAGSGLAARPTPQLERIAAAADRVAKAQYLLGEFIDRFHGPHPEASGGADPVTVSYRDNLDRLFANLDTLETRIAVLGDIG